MRAGQPLAVGIRDHRPLRDAQQRVMRLVKIAIREMDVVGRDQRQAVAIGQLDEARLAPRLFRRAVAHQLDIEPVRKSRRELAQHRFGGFGLPFREQPPDRPLRTAGQAEQPLAGAGQVGSG